MKRHLIDEPCARPCAACRFRVRSGAELSTGGVSDRFGIFRAAYRERSLARALYRHDADDIGAGAGLRTDARGAADAEQAAGSGSRSCIRTRDMTRSSARRSTPISGRTMRCAARADCLAARRKPCR